jgi:hypothetical protein
MFDYVGKKEFYASLLPYTVISNVYVPLDDSQREEITNPIQSQTFSQSFEVIII